MEQAIIKAAQRTLFGSLSTLQPGRYSSVSGNATTSAAQLNANMRAISFVITANCAIDRVGFEVTIAGEASSILRCGIYSDNGNGFPGSLLVELGTKPVNAVAVVEYMISPKLRLKPGIYWLAGALQGAASTPPTLRVATEVPFGAPAESAANAIGSTPRGLTTSGVTGGLPAVFPAGAVITGVVPRFCWRIA